MRCGVVLDAFLGRSCKTRVLGGSRIENKRGGVRSMHMLEEVVAGSRGRMGWDGMGWDGLCRRTNQRVHGMAFCGVVCAGMEIE